MKVSLLLTLITLSTVAIAQNRHTVIVRLSPSDCNKKEILPPFNLEAIPISQSQITLSWNNPSNESDGLLIERSIGFTQEFEEIKQIQVKNTDYIDQGLTPSTDYAYRLRAFKGDSFSEYSNEARATTFGEVKVWNQITPNGDGIHDVWHIENIERLESINIKVFTSTGIVVFESNNANETWDGSRNGLLLPNGVYYYTITLGTGRTLNGYVSLIY